MRDTIVRSYRFNRQPDGRMIKADHSFHYWSVAEVVRRNQ